MLYCPRCQILADKKCHICGRKSRPAEETDPVLFLIADALHADMIEPVLEQNDIPYSRIGTLGTGLTMYTGPHMETFRFFTSFAALKECRELIVSIFGEDPQIMEGLIPEFAE